MCCILPQKPQKRYKYYTRCTRLPQNSQKHSKLCTKYLNLSQNSQKRYKCCTTCPLSPRERAGVRALWDLNNLRQKLIISSQATCDSGRTKGQNVPALHYTPPHCPSCPQLSFLHLYCLSCEGRNLLGVQVVQRVVLSIKEVFLSRTLREAPACAVVVGHL
jgi:hypothetical protein